MVIYKVTLLKAQVSVIQLSNYITNTSSLKEITGVDDTNVNYILENKDKIMRKLQKVCKSSISSTHMDECAGIDALLLEWISQCKIQNFKPSPAAIKMHVMNLADMLNVFPYYIKANMWAQLQQIYPHQRNSVKMSDNGSYTPPTLLQVFQNDGSRVLMPGIYQKFLKNLKHISFSEKGKSSETGITIAKKCDVDNVSNNNSNKVKKHSRNDAANNELSTSSDDFPPLKTLEFPPENEENLEITDKELTLSSLEYGEEIMDENIEDQEEFISIKEEIGLSKTEDNFKSDIDNKELISIQGEINYMKDSVPQHLLEIEDSEDDFAKCDKGILKESRKNPQFKGNEHAKLKTNYDSKKIYNDNESTFNKQEMRGSKIGNNRASDMNDEEVLEIVNSDDETTDIQNKYFKLIDNHISKNKMLAMFSSGEQSKEDDKRVYKSKLQESESGNINGSNKSDYANASKVGKLLEAAPNNNSYQEINLSDVRGDVRQSLTLDLKDRQISDVKDSGEDRADEQPKAINRCKKTYSIRYDKEDLKGNGKKTSKVTGSKEVRVNSTLPVLKHESIYISDDENKSQRKYKKSSYQDNSNRNHAIDLNEHVILEVRNEHDKVIDGNEKLIEKITKKCSIDYEYNANDEVLEIEDSDDELKNVKRDSSDEILRVDVSDDQAKKELIFEERNKYSETYSIVFLNEDVKVVAKNTFPESLKIIQFDADNSLENTVKQEILEIENVDKNLKQEPLEVITEKSDIFNEDFRVVAKNMFSEPLKTSEFDADEFFENSVKEEILEIENTQFLQVITENSTAFNEDVKTVQNKVKPKIKGENTFDDVDGNGDSVLGICSNNVIDTGSYNESFNAPDKSLKKQMDAEKPCPTNLKRLRNEFDDHLPSTSNQTSNQLIKKLCISPVASLNINSKIETIDYLFSIQNYFRKQNDKVAVDIIIEIMKSFILGGSTCYHKS